VTHEEMNELYELYSLGVLEYQEAVEIDSHIADGCEYCQERIQEAVNFTTGLSGLVELVQPPARLRKRVLASVQPERVAAPIRSWIAAFSLLAAACAGLIIFAVWSVRDSRDTKAELERAVGERNQLRSALQILTEQQTRTVRFGQTGDSVHGWLFVNRDTGFVFVGSNLPQITSDRTFELWLVPGKGNPAPAGLFRPSRDGQFVLTSQTRITPAQYAAVAVSVEPKSGSAAPTTKPFLIVPLT
jgi:anti-sigma-K factor RskA